MARREVGTARRKRWLLLSTLVVWGLSQSFSVHALTIIPNFDLSVTSNPNAAAVIADVQTAINFYQSTFTAPITVQMSFSEALLQGFAGTSSAGILYISDYNTVYKPALLAADSTSLIGQIALSNLPLVPDGTNIWYTSAAGRALGLNTPPTVGIYDGLIILGSNNEYVIPPPGVPLNGFSGLQAIEHEMNEVLGIGNGSLTVPPLTAPPISLIGPMNLFSQNVADKVYFSIDGGRTLLAQFNAGAPGVDPGDFTGCQVQGFNCFGQNVRLDASSPEVLALTAIGYGSVSSVTAAPEPSRGLLLASGLAWLAAWRLGKKQLVAMLRRLLFGAVVLSLATSPVHALMITPIYEPSWTNAPIGATADVQNVINDFQSTFTNPVNITIQVGWGDVANTFDLKKLGDLGAAWFPELFQAQPDQNTLAQTEKLIRDHASAHPENTAINTVAQNLPTTYPNPNGRNTFFIPEAEYKALTGFAQNKNGIDGYIGFLDLAPLRYGDGSGVAGGLDFKGVVEHELTHAMGRFDSAYQSPSGGVPEYLTPLDLLKYDCNTGALNPSRTVTCFSIDGGRTFAAGFTYNASADTSDWNNRPGDPFNLFASTSTSISATDLTEMQALGWDIATATAPEPGTLLLLGTGLIGLLSFHRYGRGRTTHWFRPAVDSPSNFGM